MAEETLVKESLSAEMIRDGAALTQKLDELGWPVAAAFWYFEAEANQWKLIIASSRVRLDGPRQAYAVVQSALAALENHFAGLQDITVVEPENAIVRTLAHAFQTGPTITGIRFSKNAVNGHYIDDAYLYRVNAGSAAA